MAARRLLIVMLVLLGLSTLAAALVPQRDLRQGNTTGSTTTRAQTTTSAEPAPVYFPPTKITVGGKRLPVVSPVHVGDQLTLLVRSRFPTQIWIPEFGQFGFAAPESPARFELLAAVPGDFGVLFEPSGRVAARIRVVAANKKRPKRPARARSGSA